MSPIAHSNERIRLVHCIGASRAAGAEKQLTELISRLPSHRFDQSVVLIQGNEAQRERIEAAGLPVIWLGENGKADQRERMGIGGAWRALGRLKQYFRERQPHIVHAQHFWPNLLSVVAGKKARVPRVVVSHRQSSRPKPKNRSAQMLENYCNRRASSVLINSDGMRKEILARSKVSPNKIHRIYNGVVLADLEPLNFEFQRRKLGLTPENVVVITIANLHPSKGHEDLIQAVVKLRAQNPELRVLLPGQDRGAGERLRGLILQHQLGPVVRLLGERADVLNLLQLADIVVHAPRQEGFSNSILDAMAVGRAVVATNVGGNAEAVHDGVNGLIVAPGDADALGQAIQRLIDDPKSRRDMGKASRARIDNEFCIDAMVREHVRFYESLVE